MEQVKKLIAAGASISGAIKESLGMPVSDFAEKHRLNRATTAHHINATMRPSDATIAALVSELGGSADEWRRLLWLAAEPKKASPDVSDTEAESPTAPVTLAR